MPDTIQIAETAEQAFARYQAALDGDTLIQSNWHDTAADGRQLACALGVLGSNVSSPRDCPAQIMPRWLAQLVPNFFDGMEFEAAKAWGLSFYAELKRLNGQVPFSVVHDWQANIVGPLGVDWRTTKGVSLDAINAINALHSRAQRGDVVPRAEWFEALRPALREAYRAYAYAYAYARLANGMVECLRRVPSAEAAQ